MATSFETVYEVFVKKIIRDKEYFCSDMDEETFIEVLNQRSFDFLQLAIPELQTLIRVDQNVNLYNCDFNVEKFNFNLIDLEVDLISDMMVYKYFEEELVKVRRVQTYLGDEVTKFSPANERKTLVELVNFRRNLVLSKVSRYNMLDRTTGKYLVKY